MKIYFDGASLNEKLLARRVVKHALAKLGQPRNLCAEVNVTDEQGIRALNATHRGINEVTDVLSFPLLNTDGGIIDLAMQQCNVEQRTGLLNLGDVVICRARAKEQATQYQHSYKREFAFLTLHGLLHLLGYDHETQQQRETMEQLQEDILEELKITR